MEQPQLTKELIRKPQIDDFFRTDLARIYQDPQREYSVTGEYTDNYWYKDLGLGSETPQWLTDLSTWFERIWHDPWQPMASDLSGQLYWFHSTGSDWINYDKMFPFYTALNTILKNSKNGGFSTATGQNADSFYKAFKAAENNQMNKWTRMDKVYGMRHIAIQNRSADYIPSLFSDSGIKNYWIARYYGNLKPKKNEKVNESGWYRFVGKFDDVLAVRIKGLRNGGFSSAATPPSAPRKTSQDDIINELVPVFDGSFCWWKENGNWVWQEQLGVNAGQSYASLFGNYYSSASANPVGSWKSWTPYQGSWSSATHTGNKLLHQATNVLVYGSWFYLDADDDAEIEIIYGEVPGGWIGGTLLIQKYGVNYGKQGERPVLPVFTTTQLSDTEINQIKDLQKASEFKFETNRSRIPAMNWTSIEDTVDGWWEIIEHSQELTSSEFVNMIRALFNNFIDNGQPIDDILNNLSRYLLNEISGTDPIQADEVLNYIIDEFNKLTNFRKTTLIFAAYDNFSNPPRSYWKYMRGIGVIKRDKIQNSVDLSKESENYPLKNPKESNIIFNLNASNHLLEVKFLLDGNIAHPNTADSKSISQTFTDNLAIINNDILRKITETGLISHSDVSRFVDKMKILLKEICVNRYVAFKTNPGQPPLQPITKSIIYHNYIGAPDVASRYDAQLFNYRQIPLGNAGSLTNALDKVAFDDAWHLYPSSSETNTGRPANPPRKDTDANGNLNYVAAGESIYLSKRNDLPEEAKNHIPRILFSERYVHAWPMIKLVFITYHCEQAYAKSLFQLKTRNLINRGGNVVYFTFDRNAQTITEGIVFNETFTLPNPYSQYFEPMKKDSNPNAHKVEDVYFDSFIVKTASNGTFRNTIYREGASITNLTEDINVYISGGLNKDFELDKSIYFRTNRLWEIPHHGVSQDFSSEWPGKFLQVFHEKGKKPPIEKSFTWTGTNSTKGTQCINASDVGLDNFNEATSIIIRLSGFTNEMLRTHFEGNGADGYSKVYLNDVKIGNTSVMNKLTYLNDGTRTNQGKNYSGYGRFLWKYNHNDSSEWNEYSPGFIVKRVDQVEPPISFKIDNSSKISGTKLKITMKLHERAEHFNEKEYTGKKGEKYYGGLGSFGALYIRCVVTTSPLI